MPLPSNKQRQQRQQIKERLLKQIDVYGPKSTTGLSWLLTPTALKALHQSSLPGPKKNNRETFVQHVFSDAVQDKPSGNKTTPITLEALLGADGVKLYQAALKEERESAAFMDATFQQSMSSQQGEEWTKCVAVPIGGVSSSGKSFSKPHILDKANTLVKNKSGDQPYENTVVAIDGGVARETSQMRKLVTRLAIQKGYTGITDLSKQSVILEDVKKDIYQAVRAHNREPAKNREILHLAIPNTFVKDANPFTSKKTMLQELMQDPEVEVIFARIMSEAKDYAATIQFRGDARAWYSDFKDGDSSIDAFDLNAPALTESKAYSAGSYGVNFKAGDQASLWAEEEYLKKTDPDEAHVIYVIYDLGLFKEDSPGNNIWRPVLEGGKGVESFSKSMFRDWDNLPRQNRPSLKAYNKSWTGEAVILKTRAEMHAERVTDAQARILRQCLPPTKQTPQVLEAMRTEAEAKFAHHPVQLVLDTMRPINTEFTTEDKIKAYRALAEAIQAGKIGHRGKYLEMIKLQQAAFQLVQTDLNADTLTVFKDAFGPGTPGTPESNINRYIATKCAQHASRFLSKRNAGITAEAVTALEEQLKAQTAAVQHTHSYKKKAQTLRLEQQDTQYRFYTTDHPNADEHLLMAAPITSSALMKSMHDDDDPEDNPEHDIQANYLREHQLMDNQTQTIVGKFTEKSDDHMKLTVTLFPEKTTAQVVYAMEMASRLISTLKKAPSADEPLLLSGDDPAELALLGTALKLIGGHSKKMKFRPEAIRVNGDIFNTQADENSFTDYPGFNACIKSI
jgi:hypothetical protein